MIFNIICAILTIASCIVTFIAVHKWQKAEKKYDELFHVYFNAYLIANDINI